MKIRKWLGTIFIISLFACLTERPDLLAFGEPIAQADIFTFFNGASETSQDISLLSEASFDSHSDLDLYYAELAENSEPFIVTEEMRMANLPNNVGGSWGAVITWPHIPASIANLPNGKLLTFSSSERYHWPGQDRTYSAVWDPETGDFNEFFNTSHNLFCADMVSLADGRILANGGRSTVKDTSIFDPSTESWSREPDMFYARWYPTSLPLPDGRVFTAVGRNNRYPEIWEDGEGWSRMLGIDLQVPILDHGADKDGAGWWPLLHLDPRGNILHYGATPQMYSFNLSGNGSVTALGPNNFSWFPEEAIAIQYDESHILIAGGAQNNGTDTASNKAAILDMSNAQPTIRTIDSMNYARQHVNEVVLPTGEVLVVGGSTTGKKFSDDGAVLAPEIWDPTTEDWTVLNPMSIPRTYHSTAILLPDGTVFSGGGGLHFNDPDHFANHSDAQIFSPPYLFSSDGSTASRPEITSAPGSARPGDSINVSTSESIDRFTMVRFSATTHTMNPEQRFLEIDFSGDSGTYNLDLNGNPNVILPGYWMLFAINSQGVPSESAIFQILTAEQTAPPSVINPGNQNNPIDDPLTLQINATDPDSSSLTYSATGLPNGLNINSDTGLISGTPITSGNYDVTVYVSDGPNTRSVNFDWVIFIVGTVVYSATFDTDSEGFTYFDDTFRNSNLPQYASGAYTPSHGNGGGGLNVLLGGIDNAVISDASGGWKFSFSLDQQTQLGLKLDYNLSLNGGLETDEFGQVLVSLNGDLIESAGQDYVDSRNGGSQTVTTGWKTANLTLGSLPAGNHTLIFGGYLNRKSSAQEEVSVLFDNIELISSDSANPINSSPAITPIEDQDNVNGEFVSLAIEVLDADNDPVSLGVSGLPPGLSYSSSNKTIAGQLSSEGTFNVNITASDGQGGADALSFSWVVNPVTEIQIDPVISAPILSNLNHTFTASASGGVGQLRYKWLFGDNTPESQYSTSPAIGHTFDRPGRYAVALTVTDDFNQVETHIFNQLVYAPQTSGKPSQSSTIGLASLAEPPTLWVVNQDNDTISVFDTTDGSKLAEVDVEADPRSLAVNHQRNEVWVTNKGDDSISILDLNSKSLLETITFDYGVQPYGIVFNPSGTFAYVVFEATGKLIKIHTQSRSQVDLVDVGVNGRHLGIDHSGSVVYVTRFITPPLPGESTANVQINGVGGEVLTIDASTLDIDDTTILAVDTKPDFELGGRGVPNYLGAPAIAPDGDSAWVPSKKDNILLGENRDGEPLNFQHTVRAITSRVDLNDGSEIFVDRIDYDNSSFASAATFGKYGNFLFVALETSREVSVVDAYQQAEFFRFDVGRAPQGLAVSADGLTLYVHAFMDRSVEVYDLTELINKGEPVVTRAQTLNSVANEALTDIVLNGKQLFYDAADNRLAQDNYMSCASCHNDGGHDGRVWDISNMGEGLRNTITLNGHHNDGVLHWSGNFDEVHDFENQIRALAGGSGLMNEDDFQGNEAPLGASKAGLSIDLDALAAYVNSLTQTPRSPFRNPDGSLTTEGEAGKTVFAVQNCASCHSGTEFTDSAIDVRHNIGTIKTTSGNRLNGTLDGIDTPTLRGLWNTAPYLHDGSAATLADAINAHDDINIQGNDLNSLVAYLKQIDDLEPEAPIDDGGDPTTPTPTPTSPSNQPPSIEEPGDQVSIHLAPVTLTLNISDPDGDSLIINHTGLPSGLSLNRDSGVISGIPTKIEKRTVTITVFDSSGGSDSTQFDWEIRPATIDPNDVVTTLTNPGNQRNTQFNVLSLQIKAENSHEEPITFSASGLPTGLSLNANSGMISGTPTESGSFSTYITASSETAETVFINFTWEILPGTPPSTPTPTPSPTPTSPNTTTIFLPIGRR